MMTFSADSRVARIMAKVQGAVAKLRPKISPVLNHFNCVQSCLNRQESCDSNTNNKTKKKNNRNKKTVPELNSGKLTVSLLLQDKKKYQKTIIMVRKWFRFDKYL